MIELEKDNLKEVIDSNEKVVVQYGASWCGNCRIVKPKFRRLSEQHDDIRFIYVDAEKFPESRKMADVSNLPSFASFKNGLLVTQNQTNKISVIEEVISSIS